MLSIFKTNVSTNKKIIGALTVFYGINRSLAIQICQKLGINPKITIDKLDRNRLNALIVYLDQNLTFGEKLKNRNFLIFENLLKIKSYKGLRHFAGLPSNGQRTHTNKKTAKKFKQKWISKN